MKKGLLKLLCVFLLLLSTKAQAEHITKERAMETASTFYKHQIMSKGLRSSAKPKLSLAYQATSALRSTNEDTYFYIFNLEDDKGFIIVSADDRTYPVLGYSNEGAFDYNRIPDALKDLLGKYEREMKLLTTQKATSPVGIADEWNQLTKGTMSLKATSNELNTVNWNQDAPYNNKCPNRRLAGCVGTAMAIIMKYHDWPKRGTGSHEYKGNSADFNVEYDWEGMKSNNYDAISTLIYHAAVSIDTEFGLYSSSSGENRVPLALTSYFGYNREVEHKKKERMNSRNWENIIIREINENRPVLYAGQDVGSGHAFVCDGYKTEGSSNRFHINWGWGGYLNGYFSLSLLNPKTYNYSSMEAMVYNIKPASTAITFSPLQLTSEEKQVGLTSDKADIARNEIFSIWAGAIKNTTYDSFSGKIAVALTDKNGKIKEIVSESSNLNLGSLEYRLSLQFNKCTVKSTPVEVGDKIILVTQTGQDEWKPVAGSLNAAGTVEAKGNIINYFKITFPLSVAGQVTIQQDGKVVQAAQVIQGRNCVFHIIPKNTGDIIYVKANGYRLSPVDTDQTLYNLNTVVEDKLIEISVIGADQVRTDKAVWMEAGSLERALTNEELGTVKNLTLFGTMDSRDFATIKNKMKVVNLDISGVTILAYGSNPANAIPLQALENYGSLESIQLPQNITKICHNAFAENRKLKEITLPASISTYEYNLFYYCSNLRKVTVRSNSPKFINWCVFLGTPDDKTLIVPAGSQTNYANAENWKKFKTIVEAPANPAPDSCKVIVQEIKGVNVFPITKRENGKIYPGTNFQFKVEPETDYADYKLTVYANSTVLKPTSEGIYIAQDVRQNTMIHIVIAAPEAVKDDSPFTLVGTGLISEVTNVMPGKTFTVVAKDIKIPHRDPGFEYSRFATVAIALTNHEGHIKEIISPSVKVGAEGSQAYSFTCVVKESNVIATNQLRAISNVGWNWSLIKGENGSVTHIEAIDNKVVYYAINMPRKLEKAALENASDRIMKGMDYSFRVRPYNSTDKTDVRVNGKPLTAANGDPTLFTVKQVAEDLNITIQVYDLNSEPFTTVNNIPGELKRLIGNQSAVKLRIVGEMDQRDFDSIKVLKPLFLDLSDAKIVAFGNKSANVFPRSALGNMGADIESIIFPDNLKGIEGGAFYRCYSLKEITIPKNITMIGVNALEILNLRTVTMKASTPLPLGNGDVFGSVAKDAVTLYVPTGSINAYKKAYVWKDFKNIQEKAVNYSLSFPTVAGITFSPLDGYKAGTIEAGKDFKFKATADASFTGSSFDITVQDSVILKQDPDNVYTISNINANVNIGAIVYHKVTYNKPEGSTADIGILPVPGFSLDSIKAGTDCQFIVHAPKAIPDNLKVKANNIDLPSTDSIYIIPEVHANQIVTIVIGNPDDKDNGLDAGFLNIIETSVADTLRTLSISGVMNDSDFEILKNKFPKIETLDLSRLDNNVIPAEAFAGIKLLKTVELPAELKEIGNRAFAGCTRLESLVMKPSLEKVGSNAFAGCKNLTSIVFSTPTVKFENDTFDDLNPNCVVLKMNTGNPDEMPLKAQAKSPAVTGSTNRVLLAVSTINGYLVDNLSQNIELKDKYPFSSPARIKLASGNQFTFTRQFNTAVPAGDETDKVTNWETICLPFNVGKVTSSNKVLEVGKDYQLQKLTKEGFVLATAIEQDVPYLISAAGTLTFSSADESSLQITPKTWTAVEGNTFNMKPTYKFIAKEDSVYAVNGTVFRSNLRDIAPFEAYVVMIGGDDEYDIVAAENPQIPSGIVNPVLEEIQLQVVNGELVIQSPKEETIFVYGFDGQMIRQIELNVGSNRVCLPSGNYIVGCKKIKI